MKKIFAAILFLASLQAAAYDFALSNVSIRGRVDYGENVVILGFVIPPIYESLAVVIVGRGPSLAAYGVTGALQDPALTVVDQSTGQVIDFNTSWASPERVEAITHTRKAPTDPREAATLLVLRPGAYTAILTGENGATGIGIIELYGGF